jgi:hypothetical protein
MRDELAPSLLNYGVIGNVARHCYRVLSIRAGSNILSPNEGQVRLSGLKRNPVSLHYVVTVLVFVSESRKSRSLCQRSASHGSNVRKHYDVRVTAFGATQVIVTAGYAPSMALQQIGAFSNRGKWRRARRETVEDASGLALGARSTVGCRRWRYPFWIRCRQAFPQCRFTTLA